MKTHCMMYAVLLTLLVFIDLPILLYAQGSRYLVQSNGCGETQLSSVVIEPHSFTFAQDYPIQITFTTLDVGIEFQVLGLETDDSLILATNPAQPAGCPSPSGHALVADTASATSLTCLYHFTFGTEVAPFRREIQLGQLVGVAPDTELQCTAAATTDRFYIHGPWISVDVDVDAPLFAHVPSDVVFTICGAYEPQDTLSYTLPFQTEDIPETASDDILYSVSNSELTVEFTDAILSQCGGSSTPTQFTLSNLTLLDVIANPNRAPVPLSFTPALGQPPVLTAGNWMTFVPNDTAWGNNAVKRICTYDDTEVDCNNPTHCSSCGATDRTMTFQHCVNKDATVVTPTGCEQEQQDAFECVCTYSPSCTYHTINFPFSTAGQPTAAPSSICDLGRATELCAALPATPKSRVIALRTKCVDGLDNDASFSSCQESEPDAIYYPFIVIKCGTSQGEQFSIRPRQVKTGDQLLIDALAFVTAATPYDSLRITTGLTELPDTETEQSCFSFDATIDLKTSPYSYSVTAGVITITQSESLATTGVTESPHFPFYCYISLTPSQIIHPLPDQKINAARYMGATTVGSPLQTPAFRVTTNDILDIGIPQADQQTCMNGVDLGCSLSLLLPQQRLFNTDVITVNNFPSKTIGTSSLMCTTEADGSGTSVKCANYAISAASTLTLSSFLVACNDKDYYCQLPYTHHFSTGFSSSTTTLTGNVRYVYATLTTQASASITLPPFFPFEVSMSPDQLPVIGSSPVQVEVAYIGDTPEDPYTLGLQLDPEGVSESIALVDPASLQTTCSDVVTDISYSATTKTITVAITPSSLEPEPTCTISFIPMAAINPVWGLTFDSSAAPVEYSLPAEVYVLPSDAILENTDNGPLQFGLPTARPFIVHTALNAHDIIEFTSPTAVNDITEPTPCFQQEVDGPITAKMTVVISESMITITAKERMEAGSVCVLPLDYSVFPLTANPDLTKLITVKKLKSGVTPTSATEDDFIVMTNLPLADTVESMIGHQCVAPDSGPVPTYIPCHDMPPCDFTVSPSVEFIPDEEVFCVDHEFTVLDYIECLAPTPVQICPPYKLQCFCGVSLEQAVECDCTSPTESANTCQQPCRSYTVFPQCSLDDTPVEIEHCKTAAEIDTRYYCVTSNLDDTTPEDEVDPWEIPNQLDEEYPLPGETCSPLAACKNNDGPLSDTFYRCTDCLNPDYSATSRVVECTSLFYSVDADGVLSEDLSGPRIPCSDDIPSEELTTCFEIDLLSPTPVDVPETNDGEENENENDEGEGEGDDDNNRVVLSQSQPNITIDWSFVGVLTTSAEFQLSSLLAYKTLSLRVPLSSSTVLLSSNPQTTTLSLPDNFVYGPIVELEITSEWDDSSSVYRYTTGLSCDISDPECVSSLCADAEIDCGAYGVCLYDTVEQQVGCQCDEPYSGDRCQYIHADSCTETPVECVNGGIKYTPDTESPEASPVCTECECTHFWEGPSCSNCPASALQECGEQGKVDVAKSRESCQCVCQFGYAGEGCRYPVQFSSLYFTMLDLLPIDTLGSNFIFEDRIVNPTHTASRRESVMVMRQWETLLLHELVVALDITDPTIQSLFTIAEYRSADKTHTGVVQVVVQLPPGDTVASRWKEVFIDSSPQEFTLLAEDTSQLQVLSQVSFADDVYNPLCKGDSCKSQSNPYPSRATIDDNDNDDTEGGGGGLSGGIIALIVILVVAAVVGLVLLYIFVLHQILFGEVDDSPTRKPSHRASSGGSAASASIHDYDHRASTELAHMKRNGGDAVDDDDDEIVTFPWKKCTDHLGNIYYINTKTMETTSTLK